MPQLLFNKNNDLRQQVEENTENIKKINERIITEIDSELSTTSTNAVQNRVITNALNSEQTARQQADNTLQTNIENEELSRQNADDALEDMILNKSMTPTDNAISDQTPLVEGQNIFVAPSNGVAYLRYHLALVSGQTNGILDMTIVSSSSNTKLVYFSQEYRTPTPINTPNYLATFVMKKGQKIFCNQLLNLTVSWGGLTFIQSEGGQ